MAATMSFPLNFTSARSGAQMHGHRQPQSQYAAQSVQSVRVKPTPHNRLFGLSKQSVPDRRMALSITNGIVPQGGSQKRAPTSKNPLTGIPSSGTSKSAFKDFAVPPLAFGGGDNGGDGRPPVKRFTGGNGDDETSGDDEEVWAEDGPATVFQKSGLSMETLPEDIQFGMKEGRFTAADATRWINLCKTPIVGALAKMSPAVREKLLGNPRLLVTIGIELAIGLTAKTIAEVQTRKEEFWKEGAFVASDLMLEIVSDFSLVWLLSPALNLRPTPTNALAKTIASLPSHAFQQGSFALWQRASTIAYRAMQFFAVGTASTLVGHGSTIAIVNSRGKVEGQKELSPLLPTVAGWASFMVISSNFRYQTVNGIEERIFDAFFTGAPRNLATFVVRFANCWFGGLNWIWYARAIGLQ
mmetsp:Transcript_33095/g.55429  ORF Transcript_33095/g.55429 Transcript_33095/m.55429 type:complete len:413 (+) Transcript_33095:182-1420(+)